MNRRELTRIEERTRCDLVLHLKTTAAIGLAIPPSRHQRADEGIL